MKGRRHARPTATGGLPGTLAGVPAIVCVSMAMAASAFSTPPTRAQETPKAPDVVAEEYLRGIEALAWRATARRIHPDALSDLRDFLRIQVESDRSDETLDALAGSRSAEEFFALDGRTLFVSAMRALRSGAPGIVNAMSARTTRVIGSVAEGDSLRHVVYRLQWELSGSTPEINVVTLARDDERRWRILRAPELESIRPALRGIRRAPPPPPPEPSRSGPR